MAITIRTFKSPEDAKKFYGSSNMWTREGEYQKYLQGGYPSPGTGVAGGGPAAGAPGMLANPRAGLGSEAAGYIPNVPDPNATWQSTIDDNVANFGYLKNLIDLYNKDSLERAIANQETTLPGSTDLRGQIMENLAAKARGELSPSTISGLWQRGAERGIATGLSGSQAANTAVMRALGLSSEALQTQAIDEFAKAVALSPVAQQVDWTRFFQLPNDRQQWEYLAEVLRASPDPEARRLAEMAAAQAGAATGLALSGGLGGGGGGFQGYLNGGGFNIPANAWPSYGSSTSKNVVDSMVNKYSGFSGNTAQPMPKDGSDYGYGSVSGFWPQQIWTQKGTGETSYENANSFPNWLTNPVDYMA